MRQSFKVLGLAYIFLSSICSIVSSKQYAILVAGGEGRFKDYRYESNVKAVYDSLLQNGFEKSSIIVFSTDKAAKSKHNPFPGSLFHSTSELTAKLNQSSIKIDYRLNEKKHKKSSGLNYYLNVLAGTPTCPSNRNSKKQRVLQSTKNDNIFIFISGSLGSSSSSLSIGTEKLTVEKLTKVIKQMHKNKQYKRILLVIDSKYEKNEMMKQLPSNLGIYTIVSSSTHKSNGIFCEKENKAIIKTCLATEFGFNFVNTIKEIGQNKKAFSIQNLIKHLKNTVNHSQIVSTGSCKEHKKLSARDFFVNESEEQKPSPTSENLKTKNNPQNQIQTIQPALQNKSACQISSQKNKANSSNLEGENKVKGNHMKSKNEESKDKKSKDPMTEKDKKLSKNKIEKNPKQKQKETSEKDGKDKQTDQVPKKSKENLKQSTKDQGKKETTSKNLTQKSNLKNKSNPLEKGGKQQLKLKDKTSKSNSQSPNSKKVSLPKENSKDNVDRKKSQSKKELIPERKVKLTKNIINGIPQQITDGKEIKPAQNFLPNDEFEGICQTTLPDNQEQCSQPVQINQQTK